VNDLIVSKAMRFIQEHAVNGIKVPNVVAQVGVSRSGLESRFSKEMGYTIHNAIRQIQLDKARRLISDTNLPLKQVATNVGLRSVQHMTKLFGRAFHQSPAKYRKAVTP
jgi:LacI family transcriptional regulator